MSRAIAMLLMLVGTGGSSISATAAPPDRTIHVGILLSGIPERWSLIGQAIEDGLREQGYVDGRNIVLYPRTATYPDRRMVAHVDELIRKKVDVIVTSCGWTTGLASKATKTIPIVMTTVADPVRRGFVKSLARPGGNVTGITGHVPELAPKMIEYIRLVIPNGANVGLLVNRQMSLFDDRVEKSIVAGAVLGLTIIPIDVHRLTSAEATRRVFQSEDIHVAMGLPDDDLYWEYLDKVLAATNELRIPTLFPKREVVWAGAFMSLGADTARSVRRSGRYIDRIVNGASPSELPVENPTQLEFVLNKGKADQFGMTLPRAALLRASEVYSKQDTPSSLDNRH